MTPTLNLSSGDLRLTLVPGLGGSIAAFYRSWHDGDVDRCTHWLRPASEVSLASGELLKMASFPLLPFCNRLRDGRADFEGRSIRFQPNHPDGESRHPLHGIGWQRPWRVLASSSTAASLALDFTASAEWPWSFSAKQDIVLAPDRLGLTLTLTNTDTVAMPAGIGQHPYFPHTAGARLMSVTQGMWRTDPEVMPTGFVPGPGGAVGALADGLCLADLELDNNFTGWQRSALIEWPADQQGPARRLTMTAESPLDYFVVYSPRGADYFCAEPVSQCTDWLNLMTTHPAAALGGARLAPGESLSARIELQPDWSVAGAP
jgi:aldose 1-epimerase